MKTFQIDSKEYQIVSKWLELSVDALAEKLGKQQPKMQMIAIDTIYKMIDCDRHFLSHGASVFAQQIINGQRERITHYGDKAYGLSEKQLAVIAADIDRLTNTWVEEL